MARPRKTETAKDSVEPKPRRRRATATSPAPPSETIPVDEVAREAYHLFLARNGKEGDALSDWLTAERIVSERKQRASAGRKRTSPSRRTA